MNVSLRIENAPSNPSKKAGQAVRIIGAITALAHEQKGRETPLLRVDVERVVKALRAHAKAPAFH